MRKQSLRSMAIAFFVLAISYFNFTRLQGSECIRAMTRPEKSCLVNNDNPVIG